MRKVIISTVFAALLGLAATSCTTVAPGAGFLNVGAVTPGVSMEKTGEASGLYLFGAIPLMSVDTSVSTAARNGGIKKIATVDQKSTWYVVVTKKATIVTGE